MKTSDIKRLGEAWASVTSKEELEEAKAEEGNAFTKALQAAKDNGDETFVVAGKKYNVKEEEAKIAKEDASNDKEDDGEGMDKVDPKAAKKKFKDRKDKDIDNDGDVDDSDEYLHKRRQAIAKKDKKVVGNDGEKKAEISKIGEATEELLNAIETALSETAAKQQKSNATAPEGINDKESPKSKKFQKDHEKSDKKIEDNEEDSHDKVTAAGRATKAKSGKRPQDNPAGDKEMPKTTEVKEEAVVVDADAKEGSISLVDMARKQLAGMNKREGK